jgi:glycyl-tRNA synthetase (class II)
MNSLSWYFNLYYKFREYPIAELNNSLKHNELKAFYAAMLRKTFALFQLDHRKEGEIEGLISKNNYDLMLHKKAEDNLAQEEATPEG